MRDAKVGVTPPAMSEIPPDRRPNFLIILSDEHGPMFSSTYGHDVVETPSMDRLAEQGVTFDAAYCNSPLCMPSRLSFMTGRYVSRVGAWDNASPLAIDAITWPYLLRSRGYDVALCGKMHLIGPDQLHGFRAQLATDLHAQTPHSVARWKEGIPSAGEPWQGVVNAGPGVSREIRTDDEVEAAATEYLKEHARHSQPFALCLGFIAPHFPFVVPDYYYQRYPTRMVHMPNLPPGHLEHLPPAARRLRQMFGFGPYNDDQVLRARRAYYGLVSYLDDKIGRLLNLLDAEGLAENTVVVYASDHGEMLGEHGLWRKMNFYEQSSGVPLQIAWPGVIPGGLRVPHAVSLVDLTATILDLSGFSEEERRARGIDGVSLAPPLLGRQGLWRDEVVAEYMAHGTDRLRGMVRSSKWKLSYSHAETPELELYDMDADHGEFNNLVGQAEYLEVQDRLLTTLMRMWGDPNSITRRVIASQEDRYLMRQVHGEGSPF